jgi:predicted amidohydrolase
LPCCGKSQDGGQSEGTSPFAKRVGGLNGHGAGTRGRLGGQEASGAAEKFISRGGSAIVSPFGEVIAGPQWEDDEGILYADLDFEDCIRGRLDLDTAGSYSRWVPSVRSLWTSC